MCARGWAYIVKAATIILLCNTAVQIMQTFTWSFQVAETADSSILASIAGPFAYLLVPIVGVLSWQLAAAAVTGFIAKENVVGTLAVCFVGLENLIDTDALEMMEGAGAEVAGVIAITKVAALAYLMFNLYTPPCFAAIGAMNSEMKSGKWLWAGIGLQAGHRLHGGLPGLPDRHADHHRLSGRGLCPRPHRGGCLCGDPCLPVHENPEGSQE